MNLARMKYCYYAIYYKQPTITTEMQFHAIIRAVKLKVVQL